MTITEAAQMYIRRQDRAEHPAGRFDRAGRFWADEQCSCCAGIRTPSRAWPYSQMAHCRTLRHIAQLTSTSETELRRAVRQLRGEQ